MKVINYIRICNLFSHKDTKIDFEEGKNYIVGSIGKGKTLVLESIGFALFGSVALRGKSSMYKGASVELSFNYKNEVFLISRKINDASLSILSKETNEFEIICTSTTTVNQHIINLLGYNYDVFLLSNYCKQKKLSYFSELTPANRHSYIDKISGLDEAEKLVAFINTQRRIINSQLNTIKDMAVKPTLSDDVDLEFDYQFNVDRINLTLNSITDLYASYDAIQQSISDTTKPKPILQLTDVQQVLNIEDRETLLSALNQYKQLSYEVDILDNKIKDLPKIKPKYKTTSLDDVNIEIQKHNMQFVNHLPDGFSIDCPHCNSEIVLSEVIEEQDKSNIPINDLYQIKEYIQSDIKSVYRRLVKEIEDKETYIEKLTNSYPSLLSLYRVSDTSLKSSIDSLDSKLIQYALDYKEYEKAERVVSNLKEISNNTKSEIDQFLLEQKDLIETKDKYIRLNTEKSLYLERLEIYNTTVDKYNALKEELDVFTNLKKSVSEIVTNIQNNIIPLIDYHASVFIDLITKGSMSKIEITENYDILVDGTSINLKSGGQQDLASLAFRLSLGQSIVTGMLPLFIGDEIDSAGTSEVSDDITTALDSISNSGFQVILITHQDISTIENANIIQL